MVKLCEEEIHIMKLFYANQSIRNVRDISNATHDRPIPSIGTIFNIISKSLVFGIVGCIATHNAFDLCFLKLNIGNKYGLCSELKKCPGIWCINMCIILINPFKVPVVYTGVLVFTSNNGPKNVPMQPNKHISQTTRHQLIFLFFNKYKTAFIKTISSCRYVTSIKPKMYLCLTKAVSILEIINNNK
jgi:hypothetical protein